MDLTDPTRAVTATLDGPVLAALAVAGKPLTVGEVAASMPRGSEIGVRRSIARLVDQGIVHATVMGRNSVHELNRDHVAAPVADLLAGLRLEVWRRLRQELSTWSVHPLYACVFGSAARRDGDTLSDIDLLLVHQPFPGDVPPRRRMPALAKQVARSAAHWMAQLSEQDAETWQRQVGCRPSRCRATSGPPISTAHCLPR